MEFSADFGREAGAWPNKTDLQGFVTLYGAIKEAVRCWEARTSRAEVEGEKLERGPRHGQLKVWNIEARVRIYFKMMLRVFLGPDIFVHAIALRAAGIKSDPMWWDSVISDSRKLHETVVRTRACHYLDWRANWG